MRFLCLGMVWALLLAAPTLSAQTLVGTVRDDASAPLPGAQILIPNQGRGTVAGRDGRYTLSSLAPGRVTVEVRFVGFIPVTRSVMLAPGDTTRLDVAMEAASIRLDDVVIEESDARARLTEGPRAAIVLDEEDLARARGQTFGEALDGLPGVATLSTGPSIAKPVVRGLHSERVVVFNAGVPQEGQQWGGEHAPEIDPFAPARIELVRGVAGVEYGVGAMGGVIRVVPEELPTAPGWGGEVQANAFSNNRQGAVSLLAEGATGKVRGLGWRMQGSMRRAGDAQAPDYGLVNSGFFERNVLGALGLHRARYGVDVQLSRFQTELGIFQGAHVNTPDDLDAIIERGEPFVQAPFSYTIEAPKQAITHDLLSVRSHLNTAGGGRLDVQFGAQRNHRQEFDRHYRGAVVPEGRLAFDLTLLSQTLAVRYGHRPLGRWLWSVGVSGMNQRNTNGEAGQLIPNFRALTGGVFARGGYILDRLTLDAGVRADYRWLEAYPREAGRFARTTTEYEALTGALGALWQFASSWSLGLNVGTAWRPPSVNELYSFGVHHGTAQFEVGDADLRRERSAGVDATLRHESEGVHLEASGFATYFDGFIQLLPDGDFVTTFRGAFPRFAHAQTEARLVGFDGQIGLHPIEALSVEASASVVRADDLGQGTPLFGMPADRLGVSGTWHLPRSVGLREGAFTVEGRLVARQSRVPQGVDFAPPPPGYSLFNLGLSGRVPVAGADVQFTLGVENVFDTAYRDYLSRFRYYSDHPGRNVVLRLRVPFGAR